MLPHAADVIKQVHQAHRLTLLGLDCPVIREGGTPISLQYLFDIEVHHRAPAPHVLHELARVLELE